jgi:metal-dependent amidase/aminoacylase/carboxypeptidase family protein
VVKYVRFLGRAAHAGGAPHRGINALNAAAFALHAIHSQRETFKDNDVVRVHGILTRGGSAVSAVPDDVRLEARVRGRSREAIEDANVKVERALRAGALAVGGKVEISTIPGYLPIINNPVLQGLFRANAARLVGGDQVVARRPTHNRGGSTDMGDLSHLMPVIHPYVGGATGLGHSDNYLIADYHLAVVEPAKAMAMCVVDLLAQGAAKAREVLAGSPPRMTKKQYLASQRATMRTETYSGA